MKDIIFHWTLWNQRCLDPPSDYESRDQKFTVTKYTDAEVIMKSHVYNRYGYRQIWYLPLHKYNEYVQKGVIEEATAT